MFQILPELLNTFNDFANWQRPEDNSTHLLTAEGRQNSARVRIDGQMMELRTSNTINPDQPQRSSRFTLENNDASIRVILRGNWERQYPGNQGDWITQDGMLEVNRGNQRTTLPVTANSECSFLLTFQFSYLLN